MPDHTAKQKYEAALAAYRAAKEACNEAESALNCRRSEFAREEAERTHQSRSSISFALIALEGVKADD